MLTQHSGLKQEVGNQDPLGYVTAKAARAKVKDTGKDYLAFLHPV